MHIGAETAKSFGRVSLQHQLFCLGATCLLALGFSAPLSAQSTTERAFIDGHSFDAPIAIEILPLDEPTRTRDALADALIEINEIEALLDPYSDFDRGLGALNSNAGKGSVPLDDRVIEVLRKALLFCLWSENAHGPLGGLLYSSWSLRRPAGGSPNQALLEQAITSAGCENLTLETSTAAASLSQGSRADLWGFARGYAVDRAVLRLQQAGARSGWVQIGNVVRAFVEDSSAIGWQLQLDATATDDPNQERLVLKNQAVAMVSSLTSTDEKHLVIAGREWAPFLDLRSGAPVADKVAVFVVSDTAVDAYGLAVALYVQNPREGEFRSGQLKPRPAVKWILGTLRAPIEKSRGWANLEKWKPSRP